MGTDHHNAMINQLIPWVVSVFVVTALIYFIFYRDDE